MTRRIPIALLGAITLLACAFATSRASASDKLIVHEWGTFTSFAGSDGVYLDYRTRIGGDLPNFVLDRVRSSSASTQPTTISPYLFTKGAIPTLSRMETPVTYFYTDKPMKVHAKVDFPAGLLTEFYPPIKRMSPVVTAAEKAGKALPMVDGGMLDWGELVMTPPDIADTAYIPTVTEGDRYAAARRTDSDVVQTIDSHGKIAQEKFLFYRGICNIDLPLDLKCAGHDQFQLSDPAKAPISAAYLVDIEGNKVRFARYGATTGPRILLLPDVQSSLDALASGMTNDLISAGLYEKEAKAMVATWRTSWFGEQGTRLFYILPASMADATLPLTVTPKPQQMVRVMVGRLEIMTAQREQQIAQQLAENETPDLGRFAEPALRRIIRVTQDAQVKARAQATLAKLKN
jgi:hypothetical protein